MRFKKTILLLSLMVISSSVALSQPPPPDPDDPFSVFDLPLDSGADYLAIALILFGIYSLRKNIKLSAINLLAK